MNKYTIDMSNVFIQVVIEAESEEEALEAVYDGYWDLHSNGELLTDDMNLDVVKCEEVNNE